MLLTQKLPSGSDSSLLFWFNVCPKSPTIFVRPQSAPPPCRFMRRLHHDTVRRAFDVRSTACQRSLSAHWQNTGRWPASRRHADRFIYLGRSEAAWSSNGRIIALSNCSRIVVVTTALRSVSSPSVSCHSLSSVHDCQLPVSEFLRSPLPALPLARYSSSHGR